MSRWSVAAAVLAAFVCCSAPAQAADWPQFGFDAAHTSNQRADSQLSPAAVRHLHFAWAAEVGTSAPLAAPVIGGGRLFVSRGGCPCTSPDVFAFTAAQGLPLWSQLLPDGESVVAAAFERVRSTLEVGDAVGGLWSLDDRTGSILDGRAVGGAAVSVTVAGPSVYLASGGQVVALRPSGEWSVSMPALETVAGPVAVFKDVVYVSGSESVFALRASDGKLLWRSDLGRRLAPPAVDENAVYIGGWILSALDRKTGSTLWQSDAVGVNVTTPAIVGDRLVVNSQDPQFGLSAVDERNGQLLWNDEVTEEAQDTPAAVNGVVFEVTEGGELVAVDATDGSLLATIGDPSGLPFDSAFGVNPFAQVAIADGRVYVATAADGVPNRVDVFDTGP